MFKSRLSLAMVMLSGLVGCGGEPGTGDPASARATLETVLESWKQGNLPEALKGASPPVNVADYRWEAGYKLAGYAISETTSPAGFDQRFSVELRLTTPRGKTSKERAKYLVATAPSLTVVRDPES